ncbi:MAG: glycosyltransferase [Clostridiales bacterium]|nr:glycosyltransferase [Clostridiales bacterium]
MRKICFTVQRYGLEVNGGAELLTRQLAERMASDYDVHVFTTKAIDYMTWADEYDKDVEVINGVTVHRFSVAKTRVQEEFDAINGRFLSAGLSQEEEEEWLKAQGPYVPALIDAIREGKDDYDVFLFCTYLYYTTVMGIREVADKAIVLPFAHNEPFLRMKMYDAVFKTPAAFLFETDEERALIRSKYNNYRIPFKFGGAGVDVPEDVSGDRFKAKYNLTNYMIYVGRIDEGKNCPELFEHFRRFKQNHPSDLKLVLLGKPVIKIPDDKDIVSLGFVSEQDKFDGIAGSSFLVLPSKFESLSIVVLEAFSLKIPVLVNSECAVLKGHCDKSGGGFYYNSYHGFESKTLQLLMHGDMRADMGVKGYEYVGRYFNWNTIIRKLAALVEYVAGRSNT